MAIAFEPVFAAVRAQFDTDVRTALSLTTVYDNDPSPAISTRWCRFSVEAIDTQLVGAGRKRWRAKCRATVTLFEPIGTNRVKGDGAQLALADSIIAVFTDLSIPEQFIRFGAPNPYGPPEIDSDVWWRRRIELPFRADFFE